MAEKVDMIANLLGLTKELTLAAQNDNLWEGVEAISDYLQILRDLTEK